MRNICLKIEEIQCISGITADFYFILLLFCISQIFNSKHNWVVGMPVSVSGVCYNVKAGAAVVSPCPDSLHPGRPNKSL